MVNLKEKQILRRSRRTSLTQKQKQVIDEGVRRVVKEYGEVLRMLGKV